MKLGLNGFLITWPQVIKLFSCSTQLRLKFIMLINVKMPTIVGILTYLLAGSMTGFGVFNLKSEMVRAV